MTMTSQEEQAGPGLPRDARGAQTPPWRAPRRPGKHMNWRSIVRKNGKITNLGWCQGSSEADP